jgi:hypothetical protein
MMFLEQYIMIGFPFNLLITNRSDHFRVLYYSVLDVTPSVPGNSSISDQHYTLSTNQKMCIYEVLMNVFSSL